MDDQTLKFALETLANVGDEACAALTRASDRETERRLVNILHQVDSVLLPWSRLHTDIQVAKEQDHVNSTSTATAAAER